MKVAKFLENIVFNSNKPAVTLLLDTPFSKELRVVFHKGQIMEDHQAPFSIAVQVIKGQIAFGVDGEIKQLKDGDMVCLEPHVLHNLTATEESIVRLTLSKGDTLKE